MTRPLTIAIDGPAAGGKGTIARRLAQRLGYRFVDTGAMYRAVAWAALQAHISPEDEDAVSRLAEDLDMAFVESPDDPQQPYRLLVNGVDVTAAIREPEVERASSIVAQYPRVREILVAQQRRLAEAGGVVMEGRDITTVVLPDADVKLFVTASLEERARRRYEQYRAQGQRLEGRPEEHIARIQAQLMERDRRDSQRPVAPLRIAADAIVVDTTHLSVEETVEAIWRLVQARFQGERGD